MFLVLFNYILTSLKTSYIRRFFISFVFLCIYFLNAYTQIPELRLKYFSKEEGLLNLNINDVKQDSSGFIWIASNNGLFRYDGYNFTAYNSSQNDSNTLSANNISCLYTDSKGRLWVGTIPGLCRYNSGFDNFERCNDLNRFSDKIDKNITRISEDINGNIVVSSNNFILKYNETNRTFSQILSIEKGEIKDFIIDKNNIIWLACSVKPCFKRYNLTTRKWESTLPPGNDYNDLSNCSISHLSLDDNKLWMATFGEGIKMLDISNLKFTHYTSGKGDASMATYSYIDNKKNIWTVDFTGLKLFDKQTKTFIGYYPKLNDPKSIKDQVKGIFHDKQGNYWIFHGPKGVGISMALKGFRYVSNDITDFWHTSKDNISALQEDALGNLWIGNAVGGISVFKYQQRTILNYQHNESDKYSLGKGEINCIFRDSKGIIWLSSYYGGLQYFNAGTGKFIGYTHNPNDSNSIAGNDVRSIVEDSEGNLWLAVHGKGVDKFDRKHTKFIHYNSLLNKLAKDWTYQLLLDYRGNLWVATSWGLSYLKKGDNIFKSYFAQQNDTTSLSNSFINTIYEDNNHNLWIGTESGLNKYNRDKDNFTQFSKVFKDNNILAIVSDRDNNLWISSLSGLEMFDYKNRIVKSFGLQDGLISDEFNPRSCYKTQSNELYFGGTKGIVIFKPQDLAYNTTPPFVFIDKIKILNKEIKLSGSENSLQKQIRQTGNITLSYADKVITISYKALNFINPQFNQYAYKLVGFDKDWNYSGITRNVTYTNLDPGTYIFRVKASNNDGYWNNNGASINITILPPWWKTWWFRSIVFALGLSLFYLIHYARTSIYRRQQKKLNKLVTERTKDLIETTTQLEERQEEINQQNEELVSQHEAIMRVNDILLEKSKKIEEQNKELDRHRNELESIVTERTRQLIEAKEKAEESDRLKSSFLANLSHEIRTPLNAIIGFSGLIAHKIITNEEKLNYSNYIINNGETLLNLINDIMDLSKIESGQVDIDSKEVWLMDIFNELYEVFKAQLSKPNQGIVKNVALKINVDQILKEVVVKTDPLRLKQVLNNLMSNAVKFTNNGYIELGCLFQHTSTSLNTNTLGKVESADRPYELLFYVKDTGIGISKENLEIIFQRFRKIEEDKSHLYQGTGLGLAISEQLVHLLGGKIWVESELKQGSVFYFTHPFIKAESMQEVSTVVKSINTFPSLKGISILVAEDNIVNFKFIEALLKDTQATLIHAINGIQAVSIAKTNMAIQLILMDIKMPEMDGIEAFHAIRSSGIKIPVIAQTAYAFSGEIKKILEIGFDDYISKPISSEILYASIARIFNK